MANPNGDQMRQTRDALQSMAESLWKILKQKGAELSDEDVKKINKDITDTLDKASAANASAIQDTVDNIQKCVNQIDDAKKSLDTALNNLSRIKNVLNIATTVVKLASAIAAGNVQTIIRAADEVINAVKV